MSEAKKPITLQLGDSVSMKLAKIPKGSFLMGQRGEYPDEEPVHDVVVTRDFYLGVYPVTQAQFAVFAKATGLKHENGFPGNHDCPAENMDWNEAKAFCSWLNELSGSRMPKGYVADLPTEAEWEYACRAGTTTEYYTGDGEGALESAGWFDGNSENSTHPVGEKEPNEFGLYDLHGNVWEWCLDAWDEESYRKRAAGICDPLTEPTSADPFRVDRGGSCYNSARGCRSAYRDWGGAGYRGRYHGFRLGLFPGPSRAKQAESCARVAEPRDEANRPAGTAEPAR